MLTRAALATLAVMTTMALVVTAQPRAQTLQPLSTAGAISYFVADGDPASAFTPGDKQLAVWALDAWARSVDGALRFTPGDAETAMIRVNWVPAGGGQYGEMMPFVVNGRRGAAVYIRPDTDGLGPDIAARAKADPLFRDTIVYLTCVHELGHALGLAHTAAYADIMYAFGYGGDIPAFFGRYRAQIMTRADIARVSGLSADDIARVRELYVTRR